MVGEGTVMSMKDHTRIINHHHQILNGFLRRRSSYREEVIGFCPSKPITISMKLERQRRPQNIDGDFFVDHKCIDCDTCRWMAGPALGPGDQGSRLGPRAAALGGVVGNLQKICAFLRIRLRDYGVLDFDAGDARRQPPFDTTWQQALLSCPTSSIHTENPTHDILKVHETFPLPIDEKRIPGVYHCGYHSEASYGAAAYFIVHPEGNILVDSPRYTESLARKIEMLGGARYMFLTHKDDVADHEKWWKKLRCDRVLHVQDVEDTTADVEIKLDGCGPWSLGNDFELIHTPGHTDGCVCLFYRPLKILFTGDHFAKEQSELSIFARYNKNSVALQLNSVRKLLDVDFEWILPGHGRRAEFRDTQEKNVALEAFLAQQK